MPKKKTKTSRKTRSKARKSQGKLRQLKTYYLAATGYFSRVTPKWLQNFLALWIPLFLFLCLQPLADWTKDVAQVSIFDLVLPLTLSLASSIIFSLALYWVFSKNKFIGLVYALGTFLAIDKRLDTRLQPVWNLLKSNQIATKMINFLGPVNQIIFVLLFVALLYFLFRLLSNVLKTKKWNLDLFYKAGVITILVAFIFQLYPPLKSAISEWPQFFFRPAPLTSEAVATDTKERPDVYYIVLDRYTNETVLREQLGFDNSDFINFLKDNGFYVNPNAYGTFSNTASSISSTLKAGYHDDLTRAFFSTSKQTYQPFFDSARNSPVIREFKKQGYSYYSLGSPYEVSNQSPLADYDYNTGIHLNILGRIYVLDNFPKKEFIHSIYYGIAKKGIKIGHFTILKYGGLNQREQSLASIKKLKELGNETAGGRFIFSHILIPHNPYFFNADGSLSATPGVNNIGKPIREKYLGQVEFVNSQMKELVSVINQKSEGKAVIILQSDEGPYPSQEKMEPDGSDPKKSMNDEQKAQRGKEDLRMKYGVLAAYHLPNISEEQIASGADSINIFRLVLNQYLGYELPFLPKCHYTFSGNIFGFTEVSENLTGKVNPDCPKDGVFQK